MDQQYPSVFCPIQIGEMKVKNRIQFSPMVSAHADTQTGTCTPDLVEWVGAQARGGAGIVTIGSTPVDFDRGRDFYGCLSVWREADFAELKLLAAEAHRYGAKLSIELVHAGCVGETAFLQGKPAFVPSVVPGVHDGMNVEEISQADMQTVAEHYTACAKRCCDAGFDMVMVHMAHGNLVSSFLSPRLNQRTDQYGGSPENRWRFPLEILSAVRRAIGPHKCIEVRVSGDERVDGATSLDERIHFLQAAQRYADMVIVSTGLFVDPYAMTYMIPSYYLPDKLNVDWASAIKQALDIPVSVVGGITTLEQAEEILSQGQADIVAMARPMIADQNLVEKGRMGEGSSIRPCLRCNHCLTFTCFGSPVRCTVNPQAGREMKYRQISPAPAVKRVVVVGGGPAGMTAAQVLRQRGHQVMLCEASDQLGGRLHEASALWCKNGFRRYLRWMIETTQNCGAEIRLNTPVTPELLRKLDPDAVIVAVGSVPLEPDIPGRELSQVVNVSQVDRKEVPVGKQVVICGGGLSGSECALELARQGHQVVLLDLRPADELCLEIQPNNRSNLFHMLAEAGVERRQGAVCDFTPEGVVAQDASGQQTLYPADTIVTAFGLRVDEAAVTALSQVVPRTYVVGDSRYPGILFDANRTAFDVAVEL
jgi:2,4-dienoyl-CoA reductase-like NADH-dependent reductase (Old Yellow Enzyme family)/NADPH-dependent 2,4-dienoyl-CoA reductase/sulfur reductase-like enzyme